MWECFNCDFRNVDTAPVCAKCRAPRPEPGAKRQGRSFYASQLASQERAADEVLSMTLPPPPTSKRLRDKWQEAAKGNAELAAELELLERHIYGLRESIRLVITYLRSPQARGADAQLQAVLLTLQDWERELF